MKPDLLSILLIVLIGGSFLAASFLGVRDSKTESGPKRWLYAVGWSLIAVGAFGFFGMAFCAVGGLRWLHVNFEWPIGFRDGILYMPDGLRVVPHTPTGRIQVYDGSWRFQRGWFVDASAGTFKLRLDSTNRIEMITARRQMRYVYGSDGTLFASETYAPKNYGDFPASSHAEFIPTQWWLWTFTGPFFSWGVLAVGMGMIFAVDRMKTSKGKRP